MCLCAVLGLDMDYRAQGNADFKKANYIAAVEWYTKGLENGGAQNAVLYANRAMALIKLDKWTDALADTNAGLQLDPNNVKLWHRRGTCLKNQKDYQSARGSFVRVLDLDPQNKDAVCELKYLSTQCSFTVPIQVVDTIPELYKRPRSAASEPLQKTSSSLTEQRTLMGAFVRPSGPLTPYKFKELVRAPESDLPQIYDFILFELPPQQLTCIHKQGGIEFDSMNFVLDAILYCYDQRKDDKSWASRSTDLLKAMEQCPRFDMAQMMADGSKIQRVDRLLKATNV